MTCSNAYAIRGFNHTNQGVNFEHHLHSAGQSRGTVCGGDYRAPFRAGRHDGKSRRPRSGERRTGRDAGRRRARGCRGCAGRGAGGQYCSAAV